jgi:hypothetical protein
MPMDRQPIELVINPDPSFPEVVFVTDDVLFNSVTSNTQLCNDGDGMPWRGAKEKSEALLHLLVQGLSPSNGIIADMTAATGCVPFTFSLALHSSLLFLILIRSFHIYFRL